MNKKLSVAGRLKLIQDIYVEALMVFESFRVNDIGANLAYIVGAIAEDKPETVDCSGFNVEFRLWLGDVINTSWGAPLARYLVNLSGRKSS